MAGSGTGSRGTGSSSGGIPASWIAERVTVSGAQLTLAAQTVVHLPDLDELVPVPPEEERDVVLDPASARGPSTPLAEMRPPHAGADSEPIVLLDHVTDLEGEIGEAGAPAGDQPGQVVPVGAELRAAVMEGDTADVLPELAGLAPAPGISGMTGSPKVPVALTTALA